jgi:prepilin peptidase CpaA
LPQVPSPVFAAVAIGVLIATVVDIRTRRIPNDLTATMAGIGVGLAATGISGMPLWASMLGFVLGLALMMPGHLLGATGAGDVKLMAAIGAIVGPAVVVSAFLFTAIAGGVLALIVATRRKRLAATFAGAGRLMAGSDVQQEIRAATPASRFAYGPAIAVGSILAMLVG